LGSRSYEPGAVLRVPLDADSHGYARMLEKESRLAFYDLRSETEVPVEEVVRRPVLFVLAVFPSAWRTGRWPKVGAVSLKEFYLGVPDQFMQDIGTKKCEIVDPDFHVRPAAPQECVGLERVAVWNAEDAERRLLDHFEGRPNTHAERARVELG